jgi:hypothetical protein
MCEINLLNIDSTSPAMARICRRSGNGPGRVKGIIGKIKKLETEIMKLERQVEKKVRKTSRMAINKLKAR